ncbi:hypothetical protein BOX15_Mlig008755g3 [Macrostomum lignano]|uniref:Uncharacterized protein n=1 Tax=Macrostomum lignano TaxID=282301 RepID=A0A267ELQ5_9PLAT|nr:hypothetical protein BOX15_Mlig008755g3 [Macrostomum lignano]
METTKIIFHVDEEDTPYLIRLSIPPGQATLADFKNALNYKANFKFFFKSVDDDFGVVKEEIADDNAHLPFSKGKVESWLVTADAEGSVNSGSKLGSGGAAALPAGGSGASGTGSESEYSAQQQADRVAPLPSFNNRHRGLRLGGPGRPHHHSKQQQPTYESAGSMMSSDLDSTSFLDSEDDIESSRFSSATNTTYSAAAARKNLQKRHHRHKKRAPHISRTSSFSSVTESAVSLDVRTVELDMDAVQFLGISIVGHPAANGGSGGIYVGSIMRGGAVEREGSIQPGDMLLEVNNIAFENLENDEAVRILRDQVQKPGKIRLVVAKCWDSRDYQLRTMPREEPVRPIDPRAWVLHTNAMRQDPDSGSGGTGTLGGSQQIAPAASCLVGGLPENVDSRLTVTAASVSTSSCSLPESERYTAEELMPPLTTQTDLHTIASAMAMPDSGLEVRDRTWLKIPIPKAFIGSDLVDWLYTRVEGFTERKEARKWAAEMLRQGCIRHKVNKVGFSEQCYYVFGDCAVGGVSAAADVHPPPPPALPVDMSKLNVGGGFDSGGSGRQQLPQPQMPPINWAPPGPPPSYTGAMPLPYSLDRADSVSQYSSLQAKTPTPLGAMPPVNSAAVGSDNSIGSSSASSGSLHPAAPDTLGGGSKQGFRPGG